MQATQHYMESVLSATMAAQERASQLEVTPSAALALNDPITWMTMSSLAW